MRRRYARFRAAEVQSAVEYLQAARQHDDNGVIRRGWYSSPVAPSRRSSHGYERPSAAVSSTVAAPRHKSVLPRAARAFSVSPAPMAWVITTLPPEPMPSPVARMTAAMGHRMLMEQGLRPDALADEKPSTMIKIPSEAGMHGGDDVAVKLLVRRFGMQKNNSFPVSAEQCLADTVYYIEKRSGLHGGFY